MKKPRRLFRCRRSGSALFVEAATREPVPVPPGVEAWMEANRGRFEAGELVNVAVIHDAGCRYPQGEACTCESGPEIRVMDEDPGSN